jgi:hypothetical protein
MLIDKNILAETCASNAAISLRSYKVNKSAQRKVTRVTIQAETASLSGPKQGRT